MKKVVSIMLAVAVLITMIVVLPLTTEAKKSGDFVYTVTDGKAEIASYTGSASELIIPSDFDGIPVTSIGEGVFSDCESLLSVIIPDSVTTIGNSAFYSCELLGNVIIGNSVDYIGGSAFCGCRALKSITIPDSVTSIHADAFYACYSLENIIGGNSIIYLESRAFGNTAWYDNHPNGIMYIGKVAYEIKGDCPERLVLEEGTKSIADYAFYDYNNLLSVSIPDSVINIGRCAFCNCKALENVTFGNSVTTIEENAFSNCVSLENVTFDNSVTRIEDRVFDGCVSLENVTVPSTFTYIGSLAFHNCTSLKRITILNPEIAFGWNLPFFESNAITIYGYRGSSAEQHANKNSIPFIPLDGEPPTEPPTEAPTVPSGTPIVGDADGDGEITILDATAIQRYLAGLSTTGKNIGEPIG